MSVLSRSSGTGGRSTVSAVLAGSTGVASGAGDRSAELNVSDLAPKETYDAVQQRRQDILALLSSRTSPLRRTTSSGSRTESLSQLVSGSAGPPAGSLASPRAVRIQAPLPLRKETRRKGDSLSSQLDLEKERYQQLEQEFAKYQRDMQRENERLSMELQLLQEESTRNVDELQRTLIAKQDDFFSNSKRIEEEKTAWQKERDDLKKERDEVRMELQVVQQNLNNAETVMKEQKMLLARLVAEKKRLEGSNTSQKSEYVDLVNKLKEKDIQLANEKDTRQQQEILIVQLQSTIAKKEDEIKQYQAMVSKKQGDIDQLQKLNQVIEKLRGELRDYEAREKDLLSRIDRLSTTETQSAEKQYEMVAREKELSQQLNKQLNELRQQAFEIGQLKEGKKVLENELAVWRKNFDQKSHRVDELVMRLEEKQNELFSLTKDLQSAHHTVALKESLIQTRDEDFKRLKAMYEEMQAKLNAEIDSHHKDAERMTHEVAKVTESISAMKLDNTKLSMQLEAAKDAEKQLCASLSAHESDSKRTVDKMQELQDALKEQATHNRLLQEQLKIEQQDKDDLKRVHSKKMEQFKAKFDTLQKSLSQTQDQVGQFQETETRLRSIIRQKEDAMRKSSQEIFDLKAKLSQEVSEKESLRSKRKEENLVNKEKYQSLKDSMEQEIDNLKHTINQKTNQIQGYKEQLEHAQQQLSEALLSKQQLELDATEKTSADISSTRQISSLRQALLDKEHDISLLNLKYQHAVEEMKRLESELDVYRTIQSRNTDFPPQTSLLAQRLKEQVQNIVEPTSNSVLNSPNRYQRDVTIDEDDDDVNESTYDAPPRIHSRGSYYAPPPRSSSRTRGNHQDTM